ncbi:uncharacterized protein [Nicotiana tomentosiformis]|uniref:uncharacterized protein n=1 Tax=Nicotiana tomentosiformis TaxID=4098 RepID=UPI00388C96AB
MKKGKKLGDGAHSIAISKELWEKVKTKGDLSLSINEINSSESFSTFTLDFSHPFYVHSSDSPGTHLVSPPFDGTGFLALRKSMLVSLSSKNKLRLINGRHDKPTEDSPYYPYWERCNDMVIAWITNSLSREIATSVLGYDTAREIWLDINERFGQSNGSRFIQIQREIGSISQGTSDIASYFTRLRSLWDEMNIAYVALFCSMMKNKRRASSPGFSAESVSFSASSSPNNGQRSDNTFELGTSSESKSFFTSQDLPNFPHSPTFATNPPSPIPSLPIVSHSSFFTTDHLSPSPPVIPHTSHVSFPVRHSSRITFFYIFLFLFSIGLKAKEVSILKQASRHWFSKLFEALLSRGYIPSKNDYSLFLKPTGSSLTVLAVYVGDILLAGDDVSELDNFSFVVTPLDGSVKFLTNMGEPLSDPSAYRRIVDKLNFLQHTRPDVAFSVQHLSKFLQAPQVPHMLTAIHVLRYLFAAPAMCILLSPCADFTLQAYSDSDWAACAMSRMFVCGYFITLGVCPVWNSKKQQTVTLSSVEAEYRALRQVVV